MGQQAAEMQVEAIGDAYVQMYLGIDQFLTAQRTGNAQLMRATAADVLKDMVFGQVGAVAAEQKAAADFYSALKKLQTQFTQALEKADGKAVKSYREVIVPVGGLEGVAVVQSALQQRGVDPKKPDQIGNAFVVAQGDIEFGKDREDFALDKIAESAQQAQQNGGSLTYLVGDATISRMANNLKFLNLVRRGVIVAACYMPGSRTLVLPPGMAVDKAMYDQAHATFGEVYHQANATKFIAAYVNLQLLLRAHLAVVVDEKQATEAFMLDLQEMYGVQLQPEKIDVLMQSAKAQGKFFGLVTTSVADAGVARADVPVRQMITTVAGLAFIAEPQQQEGKVENAKVQQIGTTGTQEKQNHVVISFDQKKGACVEIGTNANNLKPVIVNNKAFVLPPPLELEEQEGFFAFLLDALRGQGALAAAFRGPLYNAIMPFAREQFKMGDQQQAVAAVRALAAAA